MKTLLVILLSGLFLSAFVSAATSPGSKGDQPDLKRGAELAKTQCMACHNGAMIAQVTTNPSLHGQKPAYLFKQLMDVREGRRVSPIMKSLIQNLTEKDFRDLTWYSGSLEPINIKAAAKK